MLWYKAWLETRYRIVFAVLVGLSPGLLVRFMFHTQAPTSHPSLAALQGAPAFLDFVWLFISILLAGSGIKTQTFRAQRGLHASMFYTLSLPVSRLQLLATRAGVGLAELAAICLIGPFEVLFAFPVLRQYVTNSDLLKYWVAIFVCAIFFYSVGVLFSTFLDDLAQNWCTILTVAVVWGALSNAHVPSRFDIFRAMSAGSPLFTHSLPWAAIVVSIASATILFSVAVAVVRVREY